MVQQLTKTFNILLIEDNLTDAILLKRVFARMVNVNFNLKRVEFLKEGLNYLERSNFDVILLDLSLPDSFGIESLKKLQSITKKVPIIVLTGTDNDETAIAAIREGAQDYLVKDNNINSEMFTRLLKRAIDRAIERKYAEMEKARLIASLHESREKVRIIANSAPVLIWMTDNQGKPTFMNQFCLDFTGKSLEQALIEDWTLDIHVDNQQNYQRIYQNALIAKTYFETEYRLLNNEGEYRWIFQTGVPRFDHKGQFTGFVCSGIDISQRKQAEDSLAQQAERNYILAEITKHIHKSLKLETILHNTTNKINSLLKAETVFVSRIEASGDSKILSKSIANSIGDSCDVSPVFNAKFYQLEQNLSCLEAGETVVLENLEDDVASEATRITRSEIQNSFILEKNPVFNCSAILVPIMVQEKLWGILGVRQCSQPRIWLRDEIELLEQITRQLAIAINQAELYQTIAENNQKLQELTLIDGLTGIANRRKFDRYLESEWKRLARERAPLSLILCDIDHFKLYNDTYGHQAGDVCLQKVALAVQKTVKRPADLTARYGGEELAVILPNTTVDGAEKVAKDICRQIQALQIPHINSATDLYVTLSLGVAGCIPRHDSSAGELLETADNNLYRAKKMGRNRVVSEQLAV